MKKIKLYEDFTQDDNFVTIEQAVSEKYYNWIDEETNIFDEILERLNEDNMENWQNQIIQSAEDYVVSNATGCLFGHPSINLGTGYEDDISTRVYESIDPPASVLVRNKLEREFIKNRGWILRNLQDLIEEDFNYWLKLKEAYDDREIIDIMDEDISKLLAKYKHLNRSNKSGLLGLK